MLDNFFEEIDKYSFKFSGKRSSKLKGSKDTTSLIDGLENLRPKNSKFHLDLTKEKWNIIFITFFTLLIIGSFMIRAITVQFIKRDEYVSLSKTNRLREILIQPERGVIYSQDGEVLARNKPAFGIQLNTQICDPTQNDRTECFLVMDALKNYPELEIDIEKAKNELEQDKTIIQVATGLEKEKILPLEANINELPGLVVVVQPIREYVYGEEFAHVLGHIGLDEEDLRPVYVGKTGIEKVYNEQLAGIEGTRVVQIDSSGKSTKLIAQEDSLPGKNVEVYLVTNIQKKAYEVLKDKVVNGKPDPETGFKAEAGAIVVQDPRTGGILALVNYPSYDPNKLITGLSGEEYEAMTSDSNYPFYDRAIGAAYPPGSTFKLVPASAALMENVVTPATTIIDKGSISIGSYVFRNWNLAGHGEVNLKRAIQVSNDTYFYTIGGGYGDIKGLGIKKLHDWAVKFGFGELTGIDLDGEVEGYMPDGEGREWYLGDTYITTIGQGDVLATPLQVNNMTAYFANGGYLMRPRVLKSIDGVGEYELEVISQNIVDKEYYDLIREGMKAAVSPGGTAYPLYDFPIKHNGIELAGKTGTSEYIDSEGNDRTHAWFTVFGPFDDPEIVVTVFLEGGGEGSVDAAPLAKDVLDEWFKDR